jgi:hypothetical protein
MSISIHAPRTLTVFGLVFLYVRVQYNSLQVQVFILRTVNFQFSMCKCTCSANAGATHTVKF